MSETDDVAGVFEVIDTEKSAHAPVDQTEVSDTAKAEGSEAEDQGQEAEQKQTQTDATKSDDTGTTDEGTTKTEDAGTDDKTKTQTETSETKTDETSQETKTDAELKDWQKSLPPPPPDYAGKVPEFNDEGQITNMTPQEYQDFIVEQAKVATRKETYGTFVENRAFDIAEQILPDIKNNTAIRQLVENVRTASILKGAEIDTVQAAIAVRDALGLSSQRIEAAKAEGSQNAKVKIEETKNAALETGASQKKTADGSRKVTELQKRIQRGDDTAFVELLDIWESEGKI